jgi:hypothetical protein
MNRTRFLSILSFVAPVIATVGCGSSGITGNPDSGAASDSGAQGGNGGLNTGGSNGGGGAVGAGGAGGVDAGPGTCAPGAACTSGQSCTTSTGCAGARERACFCDPNGLLACESCQASDAGAGGASGSDAGAANACPSGITSGMSCSAQGTFCSATCSSGQTQTCFCTRAARADGGTTAWNCLRMCTVP